MKKLVGGLVFVWLCFSSCASLGPDAVGPVEYNEVIDVDGMAADDIYIKENNAVYHLQIQHINNIR